jgi:cation transport regulator ChaC
MREPSVLLFGFGALLHPSKMFDRQPEWTPCYAPEHALCFRHRMGFATLEKLRYDPLGTRLHRSPACAHGVVYRLTSDEVAQLTKKERGYKLETISVQPLNPEEDGEDLTEALAFVSSQGNILIQPVPPTRRYADLIVGGAELRGLPSDYIDWLRIEQAGSLETRRTATSPACKPDLWYYATRGAFVSWSLAAAASAVWVGAPLVELISRAQ